MRIKKTDIAVYSIFAAVLAAMAVRCLFSITVSDESFYMALVHRLWLGEKLIADEWHPTQFYAPLLLPWYALYRTVYGSSDGAMLYFRILYILFAGFTSICLYRTLNKRAPVSIALLSALALLLYRRENILGPSYYNLCLMFSILSVLILIERKPPWLAGIMAACAVLSNPYMSIVCIGGFVYAVIAFPKARKSAWLFAAGVAAMAVVYLACFMRDIPMQIEGLRYVLNDPEHMITLSEKLKRFIGRTKTFIGLKAVFVTMIMSAAVLTKLRKRSSLWVCWSAFSLMFCVWNVHRTISREMLFGITVLIAMCAFPFFLKHLIEKRFSCVTVMLYALGLAIAIVFFFASNTGFNGMTCGFILCAAVTPAMCLEDFEPNKGTNWARIGAFALCVLMLYSNGYQHFFSVTRDAPLKQLDMRIESGVAKGIYTRKATADACVSITATIQKVASEYPDARVFHTRWLPWAYVCADLHYGTPSGWRTDNGREEEYCRVRPENKPDIVFVYEAHIGNYTSKHERNETPNLNKEGDVLMIDALKGAELIEQTEYVSVYHIPG